MVKKECHDQAKIFFPGEIGSSPKAAIASSAVLCTVHKPVSLT